MSQKQRGTRYEPRAASKLEVGMLEYQLKETREKLEEKQTKLSCLTERLEHAEKELSHRTKLIQNYTDVACELSKRVAVWKIAAIVEAVVIIMQIFL